MRLFEKWTHKAVCIILAISFILSLNPALGVIAATNPIQPAPEKLQVKAIHNTEPDDVQPAIGYNQFDGYYADLRWDPLKSPTPDVADMQYLNFYVQEVTKPYKPSKTVIVKEKDVPGSSTGLRIKGLNSGTIYYMYSKAYYTYSDVNTTYTSGESAQSNTVKLMTDIDINAYSQGPNQIKIEWDDVWNSGRRIDYKLYVSENSNFTNTSPIYIGQEQMGTNGAITVNEATGKIEYTYTVRDPGRVYYVKIVPDISEEELQMSAETETIMVSSHILVKTSKMSETDAGTIWKLEWSPVITGISGGDVKITYQVDKLVNGVPIPMLLESGTSTFITVPYGQESTYYVIRANVLKSNGDTLYPGIKIESGQIMVKEEEVPSNPPMPELVDAINDSYNEPIITYADKLTPNSATILWRAPAKATGEVDTDITYDIWLISDPNSISSPPDSTKIASSVKMADSNRVMDGSRLVGFKYELSNLTANSAYYFKIVAKKSFIEYVGDTLENVEYTSESALKTIITPPDGPMEQPLVPARPPLTVKKDSEETDSVNKTEVIIQIKNRWFEKYDEASGQWEYIRTEKLNREDIPPYVPTAQSVDNKAYREVRYDEGVTIDVGCVKYEEGMQMDELNTLPANKIVGFSVTPNDPDEDPLLNVREDYANPGEYAVYGNHNIDIKLTGLEPNTTYIIWVRASRLSVNLVSGPSDPIVVTTDPEIGDHTEKPTVPVINYTSTGDTYVDLGWEFKPGYNYYIKYGIADDIDSAGGSISVTAAELADAGLGYYRVEGLDQNTLYYFFLQAEAVNGNETSKSDWSDSYPLKTLPFTAPASPSGFGIKNGEDAVTKNSITFEWIKEDGLEYILEMAGGIDYSDVVEYNAGSVSEYKAESLRSNYRYFARLYAYDPLTGLTSEATASISVRTLRSSDDYDSDEDVENIVSGDFIVKDPSVVKGIWNIKILGANADRFIEHVQKDEFLDYRIDASKPPSKVSSINIAISGNVFTSLTKLRENLIISTDSCEYIIRPYMLADEGQSISPGNVNAYYEIVVSDQGKPTAAGAQNIKFKTNATRFIVNSYSSGNGLPLATFNKPLKLAVKYSESSWYKEGVTSGYVYEQSASKWNKAVSSASFDQDTEKGYVNFEMQSSGDFAVAETGNNYYDDIQGNRFQSSINNVASVHEIKSITGRTFNPDGYVKTGEAVKFVFDVLNYKYGSDYMTAAVKSGIIGQTDINNAAGSCTREKAIWMAVRLYEIKSGEAATPYQGSTSLYSDMSKVSSSLRSKVAFAAENGIPARPTGGTLEPKAFITRGEVMAMLEKVLVMTGEI